MTIGIGIGLSPSITSSKVGWFRSPAYHIAAHSGGTIAPGLIADLGRRRYALPMNLTAAQILAATPGEIAAAMQACEASDIFDFSRASATTALVDGTLTSIATNQPAFDDRGLALFSGKTNFVRRSSHTPEHPWQPITHNGITATIVGAGLTGDVPFAEFELTGTNTDSWAEPFVSAEHSLTADFVLGDAFSASVYAQCISGVWPAGAVIGVGVHEDSGSGYLTGGSYGLGLTTNPQRIVFSWAISSPAATVTRSSIILDGLGAPGATTFTGQVIRVYGWQLEKSPFATPLIQTLGDDIATRAADNCKLTPRATALLLREAGGVIVQAGPTWTDVYGRIIGGDAYPGSDFIALGRDNIDQWITCDHTVSSGSGDRQSPFGAALGFDATAAALAVNGGDVGLTPTKLDPTGGVWVGRTKDGDFAQGFYQSLVIYPDRPSDEALSAKAVPYV